MNRNDLTKAFNDDFKLKKPFGYDVFLNKLIQRFKG